MSSLNQSKLKTDLMWNYLSLGIMASSGIAINIIIASFYGPEALGVFNQVYAIFVISSQISTMGLHHSVLKYTAEANDEDVLQNIIASGMLLALLLSSLAAIILFATSPFLGEFFQSENVAKGVEYIAPALVFFSVNKVLLAFINGREMMKIYALGNGARFLSIPIFLLILSSMGVGFEKLTLSFLFAESIVFVLLIGFAVKPLLIGLSNIMNLDLYKHLSFGSRALFSGIFLEINSRVDILVLAYFLDDSSVGIYSFFALIGEGIYNLFVVIKNNFSPKLVKLYSKSLISELNQFVRQAQNKIYFISFIVIALIIIILHQFLFLIPNGEIFQENVTILVILSSGIWLISGYIPFESFLTLAGHPELQSLQSFIIVILNLLLNILLIPYFGVLGAAIATAISFISSIVLLNVFIYSYLGITLRGNLSK